MSEGWTSYTYCIKEKLGVVSIKYIKLCVVIVNLILKLICCCFLLIGTTNTYNFAIERLRCYDCDDFCGIYPNIYGQSYNPESPVLACQFCCKANYQHWLALANEDGMIGIQDTSLKSKRSKSGETFAEGKSILTITTWINNESWETHIPSVLAQSPKNLDVKRIRLRRAYNPPNFRNQFLQYQ